MPSLFLQAAWRSMLTESVLATVLSVFIAVAAVILLILFGKPDRFRLYRTPLWAVCDTDSQIL